MNIARARGLAEALKLDAGEASRESIATVAREILDALAEPVSRPDPEQPKNVAVIRQALTYTNTLYPEALAVWDGLLAELDQTRQERDGEKEQRQAMRRSLDAAEGRVRAAKEILEGHLDVDEELSLVGMAYAALVVATKED